MANVPECATRIGERIRKLRDARGWTLDQIGERGFSPGTWQQIETASRQPNVGTLVRMCEVLEIDLFTLLKDLNADGIY